jgi:hypothetical protein
VAPRLSTETRGPAHSLAWEGALCVRLRAKGLDSLVRVVVSVMTTGPCLWYLGSLGREGSSS